MVRRVLGIVLMVLGLVAVGLGVASATLWRTADTVTAVSPAAEVPLVLIEPGVSAIVDDEVDLVITPAEPTQQVTLVRARDVDAAGWIADAGVQRVQNLADWEELVTETTEGSQEVPDPLVSDMWLDTEQVTGTLTLEDFRGPTDRTVLLIVRDGTEGPAPTVSFTWQREVATPYLMPLVGGGLAGFVLGLGLFVSSFVGRPSKAERRAAKAQAKEAKAAAKAAGATPATPEEAAGVSDPDDRETVVLPRVREAAALAAPGETADGEGPGNAAGTTGTAGVTGTADAAGADRPSVSDPGPGTAETAILTRRQLRAMRARGQEPDLEAIAAGIGPAQETSAADAPDSYPHWLRGEQEDAEAPAPAGDAPSSDAWRRRWGVVIDDSSGGESPGEQPGPIQEATDEKPEEER